MAGKVKYRELTIPERKKFLGELYSMIALLKSRDEVKKFFKDLLTLSEVVMISRRIQVAKMLLDGGTHEEIRKELKVGYSTINQVKRWLNHGFGGYEKIIRRYKKNNPKIGKFEKQSAAPFSLEWLKKKYPTHYLLFNLLAKK